LRFDDEVPSPLADADVRLSPRLAIFFFFLLRIGLGALLDLFLFSFGNGLTSGAADKIKEKIKGVRMVLLFGSSPAHHSCSTLTTRSSDRTWCCGGRQQVLGLTPPVFPQRPDQWSLFCDGLWLLLLPSEALQR
jgi:hypothetical protein